MASLILSRRDLDFLLYEWLDVESLCARPRFAEHGRETFDAVLDLCEQLATDKFANHNRQSDEHEPQFDGERVSVIPAVGDALRAFSEAGLMAAAQDAAYGGMQLPSVVDKAGFAWFKGANVATAAYPMLTIGNANTLLKCGSAEQIDTYVRPLLAGRFFGTMCLSEPQADGSYRLRGNKMWISGGEHELSENIVHLVLAGLNHKMGYRGTTNCLLNFGEGKHRPQGQPGAVGWLVGNLHQGLAAMFNMMNEARIAVGLGAVMLGYTGYLHALDYARNRPQGRHPQDKDPAKPQIAIVEHTDVKRMLLAQKAYVEGGLALILYCARLVDEEKTAEDDTARAQATLLLDILTPIAKSWPSQWCLEANNLAIQVHGGYGYTREYAVEQFYRDNRLNPIHEGTHGIQGLDLLGRKVVMRDGAAFRLLSERVEDTIGRAASLPQANALRQRWERLAVVTATLHAAGDLNVTLANASVYLEAFGHLVVGWIWLEQAIAAQAGHAASQGDRDFYAGKLQAFHYYFAAELPKVDAQLALLASLDTTALDMQDGWF